MEVPEPVSVDQVLLTIQAALSIDTPTRSAAEGTLRAWEADAAPGFLLALMRIVEQQSIDAVGAAGGGSGMAWHTHWALAVALAVLAAIKRCCPAQGSHACERCAAGSPCMDAACARCWVQPSNPIHTEMRQLCS